MTWQIEFDERARKELRRLDATVQKSILRYLRSRVATSADPRRMGKALTGDLAGLWRYRVGDWRMVCRIEDQKLIVLVLVIGHRREVYR
ncbi:MAG: type II toxin-antitoxin system RelE/ParE family toxin [Rhodospirillales bacterium]